MQGLQDSMGKEAVQEGEPGPTEGPDSAEEGAAGHLTERLAREYMNPFAPKR